VTEAGPSGSCGTDAQCPQTPAEITAAAQQGEGSGNSGGGGGSGLLGTFSTVVNAGASLANAALHNPGAVLQMPQPMSSLLTFFLRWLRLLPTRHLLESRWRRAVAWRAVTCRRARRGPGLSARPLRRWHSHGRPDSSVWTTRGRPVRAPYGPRGLAQRKRLQTEGPVIRGVELEIRHDDGRKCAPGSVGELGANIAVKPPAAIQGTVKAIWESLDMTRSGLATPERQSHRHGASRPADILATELAAPVTIGAPASPGLPSFRRR
jgi:hypothetical protein